MYIITEVGKTESRFTLCDGENSICTSAFAFGTEAFYKRQVHDAFYSFIDDAKIDQKAIDCLVLSDSLALEEKLFRATLTPVTCVDTSYCESMKVKYLEKSKRRESIISEVEKNKIIAIIRGICGEELLPAIEAMYRGGIRLCEITFDASGKRSDREVAADIQMLCRHFEGRMLVGAGTVLTERQVEMTYNAGGSYIISPNADHNVILRTRALGIVSMPGAMTPTEIAAASQCGADFVKVFPADQFSLSYAKAVKAPLSRARLLAVGGVTAENAADFINAGYDGLGVGSGIANKKLISAGDYDKITALSQKFVAAVK